MTTFMNVGHPPLLSTSDDIFVCGHFNMGDNQTFQRKLHSHGLRGMAWHEEIIGLKKLKAEGRH